VDAPKHPANIARSTYIEVDGLVQPAPAPRFGRTPSEVRHSGHDVGQDTDVVLTEMGFGEHELASLKADGSIV
jgi:alpha-methylacyl-CoA racemase